MSGGKERDRYDGYEINVCLTNVNTRYVVNYYPVYYSVNRCGFPQKTNPALLRDFSDCLQNCY